MDYESAVNAIQEQVAQNNAWSAEQAQHLMDWQTEMSNTAHQREVADLKAAGLNPVLSAKGGSGASTPSGALAQGDNSATSALVDIMSQMAQAENARAIAELKYGSGSGRYGYGSGSSVSSIGQYLTSQIFGDSPVGQFGYDLLSGIIGQDLSGVINSGASWLVDSAHNVGNQLQQWFNEPNKTNNNGNKLDQIIAGTQNVLNHVVQGANSALSQIANSQPVKDWMKYDQISQHMYPQGAQTQELDIWKTLLSGKPHYRK